MKLAGVALVAGVALLIGGCQGDSSETDRPTPLTSDAPSAPTPTPVDLLPDLCPSEGPRDAAGRNALPKVSLRCLGSERSRSVQRLTGRPLVLNFWASWCGPCKVELPLLARAHREWGDRVAFVGIDVQDASGPAWKILTEAGARYPQLEDPRGVTRVPFGWTSGLPMTVFVDGRGRMVGTERTSFRTYAELTAAIRRHLGASLTEGNP